jgi:hypothetical protein
MCRGGVLSAGSYAGADFVWLADERGFGMWSTKAGVVASANTDEVLLEGARVPRGDVKAIHTFVGRDYVVRGIHVERADGALLPLVSERDAVAAAVDELAARIDRLPDAGKVGAIKKAFVHADRRAVLRCAPSPANPERMRFAELRVASESGQSTTSQ